MLQKTNLKAKALLASARNKELVQFTRSFEQGSTTGYVMDVGPKFFLLALVDDLIRFNGFQCIRLQDVRNLQVPAKYSKFVAAALRKRDERIPKRPRVKIGSLNELLETAGHAYPIITIHREKIAPDVCHVGRVEQVSEAYLSLLEIGPDARWDDEPVSYRNREITRVDFDGDYEEALILVGGSPNKSEMRRRSSK